ncbi:DUF3325 family protein [Comamonas sp. 7D-2evo2]|nr:MULTISPECIES: DUF3325 family protein [Comamonas]UNV93263.1 DUF3325 family protein [Comamonas sp. 7D-2evo1]UNW02897.1 DUF3325 family protein [Comamonas sp. 7D-2evo2]
MPCLSAWGFSVGVMVWLGWLSIGALLAVALVSAAAHWACCCWLHSWCGGSGLGLARVTRIWRPIIARCRADDA